MYSAPLTKEDDVSLEPKEFLTLEPQIDEIEIDEIEIPMKVPEGSNAA